MFSKVLVPQILVIEKNPQIMDILTSCISTFKVQIEHVQKIQGIKDKSLVKYSLIVADINLKEESSITFIKNVRKKRILFPIILIGRDNLDNKILSYKLGINVYHEKPIKCELLKMQIQHLSILFHHSIIMELGSLKIDTASRGVICEYGFIPLTTREFNLLLLLIRAGGSVLSPKQIANLTPYEEDKITESAIHTIICRIRAKLRDRIPQPLILTRHQAGYSINHYYLQNLRFGTES